MPEKLVAIDFNSLLYRAYHALPALTTREGQPTNAVYGLAQMILLLLEQEQPDLMAAAMDTPGPTFRHEEFAGYKITRPPMPDDLVVQVKTGRELLEALGIRALEAPGFEADDILGALASLARRHDVEAVIVTSDRDALQLVGEGVSVLRTYKGVTETARYDAAKVTEEFGLAPEQLVDARGLTGDTSDDIPGVPGIGPKTALALLQQFGSLEAVLAGADQIENARIRDKIKQFADQAALSKRLSVIRTDVPLDVTLEDLRLGPINSERLREAFAKLEFTTLLARVPGVHVSERARAYETLSTAGEVRARASAARGRTVGLAVALDGEKAHKATLLGLAVAPDEGEGWFVPASLIAAWEASVGDGGLFAGSEDTGPAFDPQAAQTLAALLSDPTTIFVTPNVKLSHAVLDRHGLPPHGGRDPLLAAYLLDPDRSDVKFADIALERLGLRLEPAGSQAADLCAEADAALRVWPALERDLRNLALWDLFEQVETPLAPILADMELAGVALDVDRLQAVEREMTGRLQRLQAELFEQAGEQFNPDSPAQLGRILFEKLKLPAGRRTKTGYSTSAQVLAGLVEKHPVVRLVLEYRELAKLKSTYVDGLRRAAEPGTHRVHTTLEQHVAATGRLSSREPNLQNIPIRTEWGREIRACFVAGRPDHRLVAADYSQIELRLLAHFSQDEGLLAAFRAGQDIHQRTASRLFHVPPEQVTPEQRRQAKTVNFAVLYGMGAASLATELKIGRDEAQHFIDSYFREMPGVRRYMDQTLEAARRQGYVTTVLGRRRAMPGLHAADEAARSYAQRAAVNTPVQGSAADIIKLAMINVAAALQEQALTARLLLQVHDELLFEAPETEVPLLGRVVKEVMETAYELSVPVVAEVKAGPNWKDLEPLT